jgi:hypothetical protein
MQALNNAEILSVWERGTGLHALDRGLLALRAALATSPEADVADWPVGRRNRALTELHVCCFGTALDGWLACVRCGDKLEFNVGCLDLLEADGGGTREDTVRWRGQSFRLPTSRDLAHALSAASSRESAVRLVEGCRLDAGDPQSWSDTELDEVGQQMALADPLAETRLSLHCPSCGHEWEEILDIATFVWAEVEAKARRLLCEIHAIASAYGWTEREILALSARRRALYFEMVQQ